MAEKIRVVLIKAGLPTVEEARARLGAELERARASRVQVLKIIHGYGSSGVGGSLRDAIRRSLQKRKKEGKIRGFVSGEKWTIFEEPAREMLELCPELQKDPDLDRYNEGVTFVLI